MQPTTDEDRQRSAAVARALGDPKRLCVLESLAGGEASVGELATRVACQVPNMRQHLAVLRSAGLVSARRDGSNPGEDRARPPPLPPPPRPPSRPPRREHGLLPARGSPGPPGLQGSPVHRPLIGPNATATAGPGGKKGAAPMAEIKHATDDTFEAMVLNNDKPVVVDFWAAWCGPCKMVAPEMEKLAAKYEGVVDVVKVDVDAKPRLSQAFGIMSITTIACFKPGQQPQGVVGFRQLEQLEQAFGLSGLGQPPQQTQQRRLPSGSFPTPTTPCNDWGCLTSGF